MDDSKVTEVKKENMPNKNVKEISSPPVNLTETSQDTPQVEQASEASPQLRNSDFNELSKHGIVLPPNISISTEKPENNSSTIRPYIIIEPLNVSPAEVDCILPDNNPTVLHDEAQENNTLSANIEVNFTQHSVRYFEAVSKNNERDGMLNTQSTINSSALRKRPSNSTAQSLDGDNSISNGTSDESSLPKKQKYRDYRYDKVELYAPDTGPKIYNVKGCIVTPPIITKNLPEAFRSLPVDGKAQSKAGLNEFYRQKIRDYIGYGINDVEFEKLEEFCSPEYLKTGNELKFTSSHPSLGMLPAELRTELTEEGPGEELCILKKLKLRIEKDIKKAYSRRLKYRGLRLVPLAQEEEPQPEMDENEPEEQLEPGRDIIYRVRVYRPFAYGANEMKSNRHSVFNNDIVLVGRSRLTALRERLGCPNDIGMRVDVSETPDAFCTHSAKQVFPSGFLFINNVFYVDRRAGCRDLSAVVRDWARRRGLGDFPVRDMALVRLDDIALRLGHPEVYMHQGNCEHVFTFSEVRLLSPSDPLRLSHYPCHTAISQNHSIYCTTCAEFLAKWIVVGCSRVPFDPAFFCDTCFKLYLYDKDGKKIGDFKAYSYRGNMVNFLKPVSGTTDVDGTEIGLNDASSSSDVGVRKRSRYKKRRKAVSEQDTESNSY